MTWQPIETGPKDGKPFMVWGGVWEGEISHAAGHDYPLTVVLNGRSYDIIGTDGYSAWVVNPTHWMPLPEPPA